MEYYRAIIINDLHCGNELGLTPPEWQSPRNAAWTVPEWLFYTGTVHQIGLINDLFFLGDSIDGPGFKGTQNHITTDVYEQVKMAAAAVKEIQYKRLHIIRGTGFHTDGHTSYENFLADELDTDAVDEFRGEVYGRKIHARHVVGRSDTPYGSPTQLQKELMNDILQAEFEEYQSADVLIRAHVHYCYEVRTSDSARGIMRTVYTAPGLELRGPRQSSFARKLRTWKYDVGITLMEIDPDTKEVFLRPILLPLKNYAKREYVCLD